MQNVGIHTKKALLDLQKRTESAESTEFSTCANPIIHPKICVGIVLDFSWHIPLSQEKLQINNDCAKFFFFGGGGEEVY